MHFFTTIAALLTVSSTLVAVQGVPTDDKYHKHPSHPKHCPPKQFYYPERDCCLPRGGPVKHYPVPKGKHCPHDYYWSHEKNCCVPKHEKHPKPKCPKGLIWKDHCCKKPEHHGKHDDNKWDDKHDDKKDGKHGDKKDDKHDHKKGDKNDHKKHDDKHDHKHDDKHDDKHDNKKGDKYDHNKGGDKKWDH